MVGYIGNVLLIRIQQNQMILSQIIISDRCQLFLISVISRNAQKWEKYIFHLANQIGHLGTRKIIFLTEKCHSKRQKKKKAKHKIYEKIMLAISQIMINF